MGRRVSMIFAKSVDLLFVNVILMMIRKNLLIKYHIYTKKRNVLCRKYHIPRIEG